MSANLALAERDGNEVTFSAVEGRWVDACDLLVGDVLLLKDRGPTQVTAVALRPAAEPVYNFHVDELHCYAVGHSHVLVHNSSGGPSSVNHFDEIAGFREREGLPAFDPDDGTTGTVARAVARDGQARFGLNSGFSPESVPARMEIIRQLQAKGYFQNVNNIGQAPMLAHAEAHALMQIMEATGASQIELYVDRSLCGACRRQLGLLADHFGITELNVYELGNSRSIPIRPRT